MDHIRQGLFYHLLSAFGSVHLLGLVLRFKPSTTHCIDALGVERVLGTEVLLSEASSIGEAFDGVAV